MLPVMSALIVPEYMPQKMGFFFKARQELMLAGEMFPEPCGSCFLCTAKQDEHGLTFFLLR
jgi:hypothetical protein